MAASRSLLAPVAHWKMGSSGRTPGSTPAHGEQDSSTVFPLLFLGTNFVSFTTEPEYHSETQGQDSSVSRSALPAISPSSPLHSPRGQHPGRHVRGAMHILAEHLRKLSCPLHGVPTPTGPGTAQPVVQAASTRPRGFACAQPRLEGGLLAGTAVGGNLAGPRVVADEGRWAGPLALAHSGMREPSSIDPTAGEASYWGGGAGGNGSLGPRIGMGSENVSTVSRAGPQRAAPSSSPSLPPPQAWPHTWLSLCPQ